MTLSSFQVQLTDSMIQSQFILLLAEKLQFVN